MGDRGEMVKRVAAAAVLSLGMAPLMAQESVEEFYRGRSIDMVIGYSPGGGYDQYSRLVARHLGRFIPGNPDIVPRNMPGAGSRLAAAYIYEVAPQDGTVMGTAEQTLALAQAMGDPLVTVDAGAYGYLGTPAMENNVLMVWHASGVDSIEDAMQGPVPIGATGSITSSAVPRMLNELVGTRFEIITGYPGGNDINLAIESGEVAGRVVNWASFSPLGWYQDGFVSILTQMGLEREPDLPDVPLLFELAENEEDAQLLRLASAPMALGRPPMFTTPNVPEERLQALRDAFDAMVADPEFQEIAASEGVTLRPSTGVELQAVVEEVLAAPEELGRRLSEVSGMGQGIG